MISFRSLIRLSIVMATLAAWPAFAQIAGPPPAKWGRTQRKGRPARHGEWEQEAQPTKRRCFEERRQGAFDYYALFSTGPECETNRLVRKRGLVADAGRIRLSANYAKRSQSEPRC